MRALFVWEAPPPPPTPLTSSPFVLSITAEGHHDGLAWGHVDVHPEAHEWRALMVPTESPPVYGAPVGFAAEVVRFVRHRFRGTDAAVFVRVGLDVERVVEVLVRTGRA
jgi:hypothetical protein